MRMISAIWSQKRAGSRADSRKKQRRQRMAGITLCVIGNPEKEPGMTFLAVCRKLEELTGVSIPVKNRMDIVLAGAGMGEMGTRTVETQDAMEKAVISLARSGCSAGLHAKKETLPYYLAEDIIPVLSDALDQAAGETVRAVILFSGDSGFYSGCEKLYQKLTAWKKERTEEISIRIQPLGSRRCLVLRLPAA